MPYKNFHNNLNKNSKNSSGQKNKNAVPMRSIHSILKLVAFENSVASRVKEEDIDRAYSFFQQTQEKIIKSKITQIFFN
ncbi:MAG: hypothetical protein HY810_06480 [Candidatus Omnitrophica bacterium]|nr:hypothetical protein [Candidatus Omnitrophota bacterium]